MDDFLSERRLRVPIPGGEMALLRFGREGAPPLLFAHANGFCASAYRRMLEALGARYDAYAVDLRGFGRTSLPADPARHRSFDIFAADLGALLDRLGAQVDGRQWILAGHSMGAASMAMAAVGRNDVAALRLIEPVAMPPSWRFWALTPLWPVMARHIPLVRLAMKRRAHWPDRGSAKASYAEKAFFANWADGVLDDYLADGLKKEGTDVALACAPAWEAAVFAGQAHDTWGAFERAPAPISVLAANHPTSTAPPWALARLRRLGADVRVTEGRTHLIPFEDPEAAAAFLAQ